jgi:hypothetical protein
MSDSPTTDELTAMRAELRQLPGWSVRAELLAFDRSLRVFVGNADELARFLGESQEPANAFQLWALQNREGFERFLDEVDRLLHNFVAGAMTLRDHARRLRRKFLPADATDSLASDCQARIDDDFANSPLAQFVEGLRNFVLHRRLPVARGSLSWTAGGPFESRIVLYPDDLRKSRNWSPPAKRYIENAGDDIAIGDVVTEYRAVVVAFQDWFRRALATRHRSDLEALSQREAEVEARWREAWGPPIQDPMGDPWGGDDPGGTDG